MRVVALLAVLLSVVGCAADKQVAPAPRSTDTTQPVAARPIDRAIDDGVAFLLKAQNDDGSWGTGLQTRGFEIYGTVPGSLHAFRDGTTGLCVMALREFRDASGGSRNDVIAAHRRGVDYLIASRDARRENGAIIYAIWAHIYGLQALAEELKDREDPRIREAAAWHLKRLEGFAAYNGGWNYYDFNAQTQVPSMEATSFGTAAALVALHEAKQVGLPVNDEVVRRATWRLEECRLPGGFYLYGSDSRYMQTLPANKIKGSVGRTQSCNDALWLWGSKIVTEDRAIEGFKALQENHDWLAMGRKRQYPHEAWYQTSGYYYYFGHYYAARLVERFNGDVKAEFAQSLCDWVLPFQEEDGSWWDYAMWDFHKPYGTAYAVMTLLRCREASGR